MRHWKHLLRVVAVGALPGAVLGIGASSAIAAPAGSPSALEGTFDCGSAGAGTFIVGANKAQAPTTTWTVAHVSFTTGPNAGGTGVFVPDSFNLVGSFNGQTIFTDVASKNGPTGTVQCTISASQTMPGGGMFTVSGEVGGKIAITG